MSADQPGENRIRTWINVPPRPIPTQRAARAVERGNGCCISSTNANATQPPLQHGKPLCLEQLSNIADHTIAGINRFQLQQLRSTEWKVSDKSASQPLFKVGINIWLSNIKTLPNCNRASDEFSDAGEIARIIRITSRGMALQHQPFGSGDWCRIDHISKGKTIH